MQHVIPIYGRLFSTAQLEEVLDPYLADTNIGIPFWEWTKDSSVPDVWENIKSPIKNHLSRDYKWEEKNWPWDEMLSVCHNPDPIWGPQSHALRIRKQEFDRIKKEHVRAKGKQQYLNLDDPFSHVLRDGINEALQEKTYEGFTRKISSAHGLIHNTLKCTTAYATVTAYGLRYVI